MPEHGTYLGNPLLKAAYVDQDWSEAVSYTHLTLPTNREV